MAKVTLVFAVLLVALGLAGYFGTGSAYPTALIPTWFGLALGVFGYLAISPNEGRRKLFMHVNVTIGLLGFLGAAIEALHSYGQVRADGMEFAELAQASKLAMYSKLAMAALLLIYVNLCVRSFMAARRARQV